MIGITQELKKPNDSIMNRSKKFKIDSKTYHFYYIVTIIIITIIFIYTLIYQTVTKAKENELTEINNQNKIQELENKLKNKENELTEINNQYKNEIQELEKNLQNTKEQLLNNIDKNIELKDQLKEFTTELQIKKDEIIKLTNESTRQKDNIDILSNKTKEYQVILDKINLSHTTKEYKEIVDKIMNIMAEPLNTKINSVVQLLKE